MRPSTLTPQRFVRKSLYEGETKGVEEGMSLPKGSERSEDERDPELLAETTYRCHRNDLIKSTTAAPHASFRSTFHQRVALFIP